MLRKLSTMGEFGDLKSCRRKFLLQYFSEESTVECGHCDNCNKDYETFDGTIIAQKALSAVARTNQRMGLGYLVDFLRGSKSQKIWEQHRTLKTYGVGADVSKDNWFEYFRDLMAQGFLKQTDGQFPTVALTEKSEDVLKGNTKVELIKVTIKEDKKSSLVADVAYPYLKDLFDELKKVRTDFAREENVPPYIIFSDAVLVEMATFLPHNSAEMRKISGVGDLKLEKYGADFISEIRSYCETNNLESRINLKSPKREPKKRTKRDATGKDTYHYSLEMFQDGMTVADIAKKREMSRSTIETHLVRFIPSGEIQLSELVPEYKIEAIQQAIIKYQDIGALSPIKESLGENYSYGEIRAVLATM